jgi:mono/diheme cytochrome c family protein
MKRAGCVVLLAVVAGACGGGRGPGSTDLSPFDPPDGGFGSFAGPQPSFGATVTSAKPPVPLSGGTLLILGDGITAVAADPDRDQVYVVNLSTSTLRGGIALNAGDEPGRSVEDAAGLVHVVLRGGGAVATLDVNAGKITNRTAVCPAPRGIVYQPSTDSIHVACAGGELVTLPAAGGAATRTLQLEQDLRDVVVVGTGLWVSTLRTAHIIPIDGSGNIASDVTLPTGEFLDDGQAPTAPAVAWRMAVLPSGQVGLSHQEGQTGPVSTSAGGYGGLAPCSSIAQSAVSFLDPTSMQVTASGLFNGVSLPVDFAVAPSSGQLAVLSAGSAHTPGLPSVLIEPLDLFADPTENGVAATTAPGLDNCFPDAFGGPTPTPTATAPTTTTVTTNGEAVALAYDGQENLWVQTREPATLQLANSGTGIMLSHDSRADTGWAIFHSDSGAGLACASCHPEGGEDGRTWQFDQLGGRRTQSMRGKISGTAPFHWDGTLNDFPALVTEVYNSRMSGPTLAADQETALLGWIDTIPVLPHSPPADASAVTRGTALFTSQGCTACHNGPEFTNNQTVDVGTDGSFQVARLLGVGWRAPFLHDGRAATLTDRFGSGGGGDAHGMTSTLSAAQISDLVAYLNSI